MRFRPPRGTVYSTAPAPRLDHLIPRRVYSLQRLQFWGHRIFTGCPQPHLVRSSSSSLLFILPFHHSPSPLFSLFSAHPSLSVPPFSSLLCPFLQFLTAPLRPSATLPLPSLPSLRLLSISPLLSPTSPFVSPCCPPFPPRLGLLPFSSPRDFFPLSPLFFTFAHFFRINHPTSRRHLYTPKDYRCARQCNL